MSQTCFEDHYGVEEYGVPVAQNAEHHWTGPDLMTPVRHQRYTRTCLCFAMTDCMSANLKLQMRKFDGRRRGRGGGRVGGRGAGRGGGRVGGRGADPGGVGGGAAPVPLIMFSVQELYDCVPRDNEGVDNDANDVNVDLCAEYIQEHGVNTLENYDFNDAAGRFRCRDVNGKRKLSFARFNRLHGQEAVLEALKSHTILAATRHAGLQTVWCHPDPTVVYGVGDQYAPANCSGHCVLVVGYGYDDNGDLYYIIKSHWGRAFGHLGYLRVAAGLLRRFWEINGLYWRESIPEP